MNHKLRIALCEPRIPQNTGNIGRTCLAFNCTLDLIFPLGFSTNSKYLRRAGLDYWKHLNVIEHKNFDEFKDKVQPSRIIGFSKSNGIPVDKISFRPNDCLLFGREDYGLSMQTKQKCDLIATIPMLCIKSSSEKKGVRSLNLSVACGIATYCAIESISK